MKDNRRCIAGSEVGWDGPQVCGPHSLIVDPRRASFPAPISRPKPRTFAAVYRYRRACLWLTGLCVALAGCGGHYPQTTLAPRSDLGLAIDHLFTGIFGWALGVFIVV